MARDYARSIGSWQIKRKPEGIVDIAATCHILIIVAMGKESDPTPLPSDIWCLVKKARASGRSIIHIPVIVEPLKAAPKSTTTVKQKRPVRPPKYSLSWALSKGRDDRQAGRVSPKYAHFRNRYGLPEVPKSLQMWEAYKSAAGVPGKPQRTKIAVPQQRTRATRTSKTRRITVKEAQPPRSHADPTGYVPHKDPAADLLRKINPPDPDVWR